MVKLYTWLPLLPHAIFEGLRPDAGHSSVEVLTDDGTEIAYASYWPEPGSLLGEVTQLMKPRPQRHPATYAQECDPNIGFMQRPADFTDTVEGLVEDTIVELWTVIEDTKYDLLHWNCSNISKLLILSSFDPVQREKLSAIAGCTPEDLTSIDKIQDPLERLRYLATSQFIDCRPEDVRRMIEAYGDLKETTLKVERS